MDMQLKKERQKQERVAEEAARVANLKRQHVGQLFVESTCIAQEVGAE